MEGSTGIASVEYGDLTKWCSKSETRRGSSPFILEGSINQHTRQIALHKGLDLGKNTGLINFSLEHARSFSDAASPYTAYQRNVLSLHYMNVFMKKTQPLTLDIGLNGGVGGYDSRLTQTATWTVIIRLRTIMWVVMCALTGY